MLKKEDELWGFKVEMMRSFSKAMVVLATALWGLWACPKNDFLCKENTDCPYGSFCFKMDAEGFCSWGEFVSNDVGIWGIFPKMKVSDAPFPKMEVSTNNPTDMDDSNEKLQKIEAYLQRDSETDPDSYSGKLQLYIRAYGASSVLLPWASNGVAVDCEPQTYEKAYVDRTCSMVAHLDGKYSIHAIAENGNGQSIVALEWHLYKPLASPEQPGPSGGE